MSARRGLAMALAKAFWRPLSSESVRVTLSDSHGFLAFAIIGSPIAHHAHESWRHSRMFESSRSLLLVVPLCGAALLGCSAKSEENPYGSTGSGATGNTTSSGGSGGSGGSTTGTGGVTTGAGGTTAGGTSAGGSATGGAAGSSVGTSGSTSVGGAPPQAVSLALPYTEDWESGAINGLMWMPSVPANLGNFTLVDAEMGKALQFTPSGAEVQLVGGDVAWTDIKLDVKMKFVSGDPRVAIAFRYNTYDTFYFMEIGEGTFKIRDRQDGGGEIAPTVDEPMFTLGTWYTVTVVVQGQNVSASLDGTEIVSGTMVGTPIANGGIGLGCKSSFTGVVQFDDITVSAP